MKKAYYDTVTVAAKYRGQLLNEVTFLESAIDDYIAFHFVGTDNRKELDFKMSILGNNRMTLESKKQVFEYLASTYNALWADSYKSIREIKSEGQKKNREVKYHTIYSDLSHIISERNVMAHCILHLGKDAFDKEIDEITLLRFRDKQKDFTYNQAYMNELLYLTQNLYLFLKGI